MAVSIVHVRDDSNSEPRDGSRAWWSAHVKMTRFADGIERSVSAKEGLRRITTVVSRNGKD